MQCIAGRTELKLLQHRPDVNLNRVPDRGAPVEGGLKSGRGDSRGSPRRANDGGDVRGRRPQHGKNANCPLAPDRGGGNRLPVSHVDHQRDGAAIRKEDMLDLVTRSREDSIVLKRNPL